MIAPQQWSQHPTIRKGLNLLGWFGIAVLVALISLVAAVFINGSGRLAILGMAGTLGLLALLVIIPNPRFGVYALFALMPIAGWVYKQSPGGGFNLLSDALAVVIFASILLHRKDRQLPLGMAVPIVLLIILGVIETTNPIGGGDQVVAVYAIRDSIIPMLLFFVGFYAFRTVPQVEGFLSFLMLIAIVNGAWATKQAVIGLDAGESAWADQVAFYSADNTLRAFGTFQAPWAFAYYTDIIFIVAVCLIIGSRSGLIRYLAAISIPFTLAGLYFSIVRTGLVMLPVGLVVIILLRLRGPARVIAMLFTTVAILSILMAMTSYSMPTGANPNSTAQSLSTLNVLQDNSVRERFLQWENVVLPQMVEYPLGKGLGTTGGVGALNPNGSVTADNNYLSIGLEMGWAGMAIFCFLQGAAFVKGLRWNSESDERVRNWLIAGLVAVVIITILSNFLNENTNQDGGYYFYMFLGLLAFLGTTIPKRTPEPSVARSTA